eukprot:361365-Chlamydomonas_euryale.AAC.6
MRCLLQLLAGSSPEEAQLWETAGGTGAFTLTRQSACVALPGVDDAAGFAHTRGAMDCVGISRADQQQIFQVRVGPHLQWPHFLGFGVILVLRASDAVLTRCFCESTFARSLDFGHLVVSCNQKTCNQDSRIVCSQKSKPGTGPKLCRSLSAPCAEAGKRPVNAILP